MMRNSTLLKWTQNNKHAGKTGNRNWIHSPDALQRGHIAYLVKFLGNTEVDQPKGIEVVKEGIRKLKFNQQLRKAEGNKTPKVELTISIDGVAIQEPKTKRIMHQYPLHRISYCADDKGEKRFFSFIAKEADSEKHICFVFVSDKLAEEITLTIGQAFDLAYRRFLDTSGKDLEVQRRLILLQQKVKRLEAENGILRQRLQEVAHIKGRKDVDEYMQKNNITDLLVVNGEITDESDSDTTSSSTTNGNGNLLNLSSNSFTSNGINSSFGMDNHHMQSPNSMQPPPVPPRAFESKSDGFGDDFISDLMSSQPAVGTKLEGLLLDELEEDDFNPRAHENSTSTPSTNGVASSPPPLLAPPPKPPRETRRGPQTPSLNGDSLEKDLFGSVPFNPVNSTRGSSGDKMDPFGMGDFGTDPSRQELENAIGILDKKILEMKDGFSRGLSFGNDDFSLESLDPLRN